MRSIAFSEVSVVIAEADKARLQVLRSTLYFLGFRETEWVESVAALETVTDQVKPDLIVTADSLSDGATGDFLQRLRRGQSAADPFTPVICILSEASPQAVRQGVDSGADDLIIHPWPQGYLDKRLERLVAGRKPFVVTADYVGPDRRSKTRPGLMPPVLDPPNALALRALDRRTRPEVEAELADARARLNAHRLTSLVKLLIRLTDALHDTGPRRAADGGTARGDVERLIAAATEASVLAPRCGHGGATHQTLMDVGRHGRLYRDARNLGRVASLADLVRLTETLASRFGVAAPARSGSVGAPLPPGLQPVVCQAAAAE